MSIFKSGIVKFVVASFVVIWINKPLVASAFWCTQNYSWTELKGVSGGQYTDGTDMELIIENTSTTYSNENVLNYGNFYSRTISDMIFQYRDNNNELKYFIIKGKRLETSIYNDMKKSFSSIPNSVSYLTCNQKYSNEGLKNIYTKTAFKLNIKANTKFLITAGANQYAFNHNMSIMFLHFSKAITGTIKGLDTGEDEFLQKLTEYFGGIAGGRGASLYVEINNAQTTKDLFKIIIKELITVSKVMLKYPSLKSIATSLDNKSLKLSNDIINAGGNTIYDKALEVTINRIDKGAEKTFDAIFKYTGLDYAKNAAESFVELLTATSILIDMNKAHFKKNATGKISIFKDLKVNKTMLSSSVYFLLGNYSISDPNSQREYKFYNDLNIKASEMATMIVNTFVYDEFKRGQGLIKLDYINNVYLDFFSFDLKSTDTVSLKKFNEIISNIFKYKMEKLADKDNVYGSKAKERLLAKWDTYGFGKGQINGLPQNATLTRGNVAILIYKTHLADWKYMFKQEIENQKELYTQKTGQGSLLQYKSYKEIEYEIQPKSNQLYFNSGIK